MFPPFLIIQFLLHLQPVFESLGHQEGDFPVAEEVANQCLSLPMSPYLTIEEQANIIDEILFFNIP